MLYRIEKELGGNRKLAVEVVNSRTVVLLYDGIVDLHTMDNKPVKLIFKGKEPIEIDIGDILRLKVNDHFTGFYVDKIEYNREGCYTITTCANTKTKHFLLPCLGDTKIQYGLDTYLENVYLDYRGLETEDFLYGKVLYLHYKVFDCREFMAIDSWLLKHKNFVGIVTQEPYHITYILKIPDIYLKELKTLKIGKYSEFSEDLKKKILTFHDYKQAGKTGQILYNDARLRKQLELEFGVPIPKEVELFDVPDMNKEIYIPCYDETRRRIDL